MSLPHEDDGGGTLVASVRRHQSSRDESALDVNELVRKITAAPKAGASQLPLLQRGDFIIFQIANLR